jgi:hypothetical protein
MLFKGRPARADRRLVVAAPTSVVVPPSRLGVLEARVDSGVPELVPAACWRLEAALKDDAT